MRALLVALVLLAAPGTAWAEGSQTVVQDLRSSPADQAPGLDLVDAAPFSTRVSEQASGDAPDAPNPTPPPRTSSPARAAGPAVTPSASPAPQQSKKRSAGHVVLFTVLPLLAMGAVVASVALRHRRGPQGPQAR
jgi:hypothetical protein